MFCQKTWQFCGTVLGMAFLFFLAVARPGTAVEYQDAFLENFDNPALDLPAQWELIQGDWQDWTLFEGRLQAQLQASPTNDPSVSSSVISMITLKDEFWPDFDNYRVSFSFIPHDSVDKNFAIFFRSQPGFNNSVILDIIDFHFFNTILHFDYIEVGRGLYADRVNFPLVIDQEYQIAITHLDGKFSLYIDEQLIYETNVNWPDFKLGAGKLAFRASRGTYPSSKTSFDNLRIEPYFNLDLPLIMQTDSAWADDIYDRANLWADDNNTIADWGCALSSSVMLLHYYGYKELEGEPLNPATLNQWLLSQLDGYVGDGLVNWLAICRLVSILAADCENCPRLEYQYFIDSNLSDKIRSQLELNQPVIANLRNHFLIIDGKIDNDFQVKDPYFDIVSLSESENPLLSLRLFKPSFTDLSYWLFELPKTATVNIDNLTLQAFEPSWPGEQQFYYLSQPSLGKYLLNFSFLNEEDYKASKIYLYQADGAVQVFNLGDFLNKELFFNPQAFSLELNYFKDRTSELSLVKEKDSGLTFYLEYQLQELLSLRDGRELEEDQLSVSRYQALISKFLSFYDLGRLPL